MVKTVEEQMKIIKKGVDKIVNEEELMNKLERASRNNESLTIKLGLDPSAPDIHLGHAVVLRKIKQMQDLGHKAVIVIGDFTGKIGDPTGKAKGRKALSEEEVQRNAQTYKEQIFKILDVDKTEVRFNSEWLGKITFDKVIELASTITVARMLERDDFQNRYKNNIPIGVHEFFYPLMQAYDSVELKADIELGGTDQTFNILMGRTLQKYMGQESQIAMFMPILEGLDGIEKMSKSLGNYIGVNEPANIMFKKVMEIPDALIIKYFELATDVHPDEIDRIKKDLDKGKNPRDIKFELAKIITALYHSELEVKEAIEFYDLAFRKKDIPDNIPEIESESNILMDLIPLLVQNNIISSKSEFKRLIVQGGVRVNQEKLNDMDFKLSNNDVIKIGKKKFIRVKIK
ncbi:tyrosine--tRNA ligase [Clostridium paraputrificum]|uniref:tyrosine--tRNA ligase n=1 Tax=Clostridium TaxID=1485 RepID=UPI000C08C13C|nr:MULTISPECIES: tyrosine--tRNA ligase [Clostridium]MBS7132031.1 tyrosine--tRNA ligase [Clostridium sp.]MDB2075079.1 tyrosine--tRNA ligase [Clostridium paraputrificum]MDB2078508.1 tyrosine--tRNA ligase [Clostridium paraputrificum]MDB2099206.1 tyrosine--tRNA ligase [Clostridium paraputrificum]MDU2283853.1 tyrosine--tRNA ligase [Clostridium sp.]